MLSEAQFQNISIALSLKQKQYIYIYIYIFNLMYSIIYNVYIIYIEA